MDLIRRRRIVLAMDCIAWPQEPRPWKALALFFSHILGSKWHLLLRYALYKRRMDTFGPNLAICFLRGNQNCAYLCKPSIASTGRSIQSSAAAYVLWGCLHAWAIYDSYRGRYVACNRCEIPLVP